MKNYSNKAVFPTELHEQTAEVVKDFFLDYPIVDTFLVVNSCARGQASPESDLDFAVLISQIRYLLRYNSLSKPGSLSLIQTPTF